jgi:hypothetical protein
MKRKRTTMMMERNGTMKANAAAQVAQRTERGESNRRLESIKMQRRRVRREKWLPGIKSLVNAISAES